jgi:putative transferase (TIGR04331 family)
LVKYTLITTADERTWPKYKKKPFLFLGEWCRRYSRKNKWQQLNAEVAEYHWDNREKLFKDYKYLQELYEQLLEELSNKLNQIHSVNHTSQYWRILLGPWLGYFIQMLFDRWFMLKQVIEQENVVECNIIDRDFLSNVPNDMKDFGQSFVEDDWNEAIYGQLLELCWADRVAIDRVRVQSTDSKRVDHARHGLRTVLTRYAKKCIPLFNRLFCKDDGYFFISSYLPLIADFKLQIRLGQFPKLWRAQSVPITKPDSQQRQWRLEGKDVRAGSFDIIARQLISQNIPTAYLEGYLSLETKANTLSWPVKPKLIFTSNAYLADDLFKAWAAGKAETGVPIVIGQHGGHFGMNPFSFHEEHQIAISDKWLSWGWFDQARQQIEPIGNFKDIGINVGYNPKGGALMVEMAMPRYSYHLFAAPVSSQVLSYMKDQQAFLKELPHELRELVLLRLFPIDYGWDQAVRWEDQMPEVLCDSGQHSIRKLIKESRIYISTYNATTYLESLRWNVPTIIFWNPEHWELKENVRPYFDLLKSVGIFHETPESAAQQMIDVWDDVDAWWKSNEVQSAREQFCHQFSRAPDDLIGDLQTLFQSLSNKHNV